MSTGRTFDRRALFASAAAATLLAASGVSAQGQPRRGGRLRIAVSGASRGDDWIAGDGLFMRLARRGLVFDTLTELAADGTLRGGLATDWQAGADARDWRFALRREVAFHDGTPFTARDAAASLAGRPGLRAVADGAHVLRVRLDAPDSDLPLRLSAPDALIRPAHAPAAGIGTGLYRVTRFTPGRQLLTERAARHWKDGSAGWFDGVELVSIPAEAVRAEALAAYLVDAADIADPTLVRGLPDVVTLPDTRQALQAVSRRVALPAEVGRAQPFDDLRAPERWWMA